jgi:hypothetical protein
MNAITKIGMPSIRVGLVASLAMLSLGSVLPIHVQAAPTKTWGIDRPAQEEKNWPADSQIQNGANAVALVNGSFETGDYTGWTLFESSGVPGWGTWGIASNGQTINPIDPVFDFFDQTIVNQLSPGLPHTYTATDGNYLALQLQNGPETHRLSQDMTVQTCNTHTILSWNMEYSNWAGVFDPNDQVLAVHIRDVNTDAILKTLFKTRQGVNPQSIPMTYFRADISEFAGMAVRLDVEMQVYYYYFDAAFDNFKMECGDLAGGVALTATKNENQVGLKLTTTSETDTAKFQILRGIKLDNGGTKITSVCNFNSGNSPYICTDNVVGNTYRVLEIENDGDLIVYDEVTPQ